MSFRAVDRARQTKHRITHADAGQVAWIVLVSLFICILMDAYRIYVEDKPGRKGMERVQWTPVTVEYWRSAVVIRLVRERRAPAPTAAIHELCAEVQATV